MGGGGEKVILPLPKRGLVREENSWGERKLRGETKMKVKTKKGKALPGSEERRELNILFW